jgi:outer membrane protein assembly factor BamB
VSNRAVSRLSRQCGGALAFASLMVICVSALFSAYGCGGGRSNQPTNPPAALQVTPTTVPVTVALGYSAPVVQVQADVASNSSQQFYLQFSYSKNGLASVNESGAGANKVLTLNFQNPSTLGVGTYNDTITVEACYDQACTQQVSGSPQTVPVIYTVAPPAPIVYATSPNSAVAGGPGFVLTVTGSQFTTQSQVLWNGTALSTTFISVYELTAQVPAQDIATAGTANVQVANGGVDSNVVRFAVSPIGAFALNSISPLQVTAGGGAFMLTALGGGFTVNSVVTWNGIALTTTYVSPTTLRAPVTAAQISSVGTASIAVVDPADGTSGTQILSIIAPTTDAVSYQMNTAHTGFVTFSNVNLPSSSTWSVDVGGTPSYALIVGGVVYVSVQANIGAGLLALNATNGAKLWGPIAFGPYDNVGLDANAAYDNGRLFVVYETPGPNGVSIIEALDAATGAEQWSAVASAQFGFSPPVALNGIVYVQGTYEIVAFDEATGAQLWQVELPNGGDNIALTVDGVYTSSGCTGVAFQPATGAKLWYNDYGCSGVEQAAPVVANGVLYAATDVGYSGTMFNAETGAIEGAFSADITPAFSASTGFFLFNGTLLGIQQSNSQLLWSFAGDGNLVTAPVVVNNYVFIGSSSGNLYAVDAASGQQVWIQNLGAAIPSTQEFAQGFQTGLAAGDGILIVPNGNNVTAYTLSTSP